MDCVLGETTTLDQYVTDASHSLVAQSVRALEATASVNGDGLDSAGTAIIRSRAVIVKSVRPGRTRTCATRNKASESVVPMREG
jgi:hypothetical protein